MREFDKQWINTFDELIERNLMNPDFTIDALSIEMLVLLNYIEEP